MSRLPGCLLSCLLLLAAPAARADDAAASSAADPRARFRVQRAAGSQGAGAKMTPVGAGGEQGKYRIKRMSELNEGAQGDGVTGAAAAAGTPRYHIQSLQAAGASAGNAAAGTGPVIGLDGGQRGAAAASDDQSASRHAPGLHGTSFRGDRPVGSWIRPETTAGGASGAPAASSSGASGNGATLNAAPLRGGRSLGGTPPSASSQ